MKRLIAFSFVFSFFVNVLIGSLSGGVIYALDGSDFQAGKIISDSNFFNGSAMSAEQIQQFLDAKVPVCDTNGSEIYSGSTTRAEYGTAHDNPPPYTCLKSYKQNVPVRDPEESLCDGISAASNRTAAQIIDVVSRSCGVSQKVLLVLLQKEQSLVTDTWPWSIQYRSATGYGCPDSAPCDSQYYGFFNQVYQAARIYKYYAKYPDSFNHIAGETNFVRYNPKSSCGGSNVFIANQATAGLYNYTPYQPNEAALDNLYGSAPPCGAYGNRNFWRLYSDWFGDTLKESQPIVTIVGDWSGSAADEVGFKRGNQYYYDTNNDGTAEVNFGIGKITDKVIVGDWDGDGKDEVGLRRDNNYYFDNNNDGSADVSFVYGKTSDQVFVGDWDNNGTDTLGVKRGNYYYLSNQNDGKADIKIGIGRDTDKVIVGDWDGDGKDSIGLKRGNLYYLDNNNDGVTDVYESIGRDTDKVIVGDWDGDGSDTIGLKRGNLYYLDNNNDGVTDVYEGIGRTTDSVIVGDWDGDGDDSIGLKRYNRYFYDNNNDGNADVSFILNYF